MKTMKFNLLMCLFLMLVGCGGSSIEVVEADESGTNYPNNPSPNEPLPENNEHISSPWLLTSDTLTQAYLNEAENSYLGSRDAIPLNYSNAKELYISATQFNKINQFYFSFMTAFPENDDCFHSGKVSSTLTEQSEHERNLIIQTFELCQHKINKLRTSTDRKFVISEGSDTEESISIDGQVIFQFNNAETPSQPARLYFKNLSINYRQANYSLTGYVQLTSEPISSEYATYAQLTNKNTNQQVLIKEHASTLNNIVTKLDFYDSTLGFAEINAHQLYQNYSKDIEPIAGIEAKNQTGKIKYVGGITPGFYLAQSNDEEYEQGVQFNSFMQMFETEIAELQLQLIPDNEHGAIFNRFIISPRAPQAGQAITIVDLLSPTQSCLSSNDLDTALQCQSMTVEWQINNSVVSTQSSIGSGVTESGDKVRLSISLNDTVGFDTVYIK